MNTAPTPENLRLWRTMVESAHEREWVEYIGVTDGGDDTDVTGLVTSLLDIVEAITSFAPAEYGCSCGDGTREIGPHIHG